MSLSLGFGIILYYVCSNLPPLSERDAFVSYTKLPTFFGTVLFALEAVGVVNSSSILYLMRIIMNLILPLDLGY